MADSPEKRRREARKRQNREMKAERKRLRKAGLLGQDNTGLFPPGDPGREVVPAGPVSTGVEATESEDLVYVPCIKCSKPADLQETKSDRSRVFKCRNKECREVFTLPPQPPPQPPAWR